MCVNRGDVGVMTHFLPTGKLNHSRQPVCGASYTETQPAPAVTRAWVTWRTDRKPQQAAARPRSLSAGVVGGGRPPLSNNPLSRAPVSWSRASLRVSNWTENERSPGALSRQDEMSDEGWAGVRNSLVSFSLSVFLMVQKLQWLRTSTLLGFRRLYSCRYFTDSNSTFSERKRERKSSWCRLIW